MEPLNDVNSTNFIDILEITGSECRLCLKKSSEMWGLFQCQDTPQKIMACTTVQVSEGDGLPTVICCTCRRLLDLSYGFKCQVEKSDARLRQVLSSFNSSQIQTVENVVLNSEESAKTVEIIHQFEDQGTILFQMSNENQQTSSSSSSTILMGEFVSPSQNDCGKKGTEISDENFFNVGSNVYSEAMFSENIGKDGKDDQDSLNEKCLHCSESFGSKTDLQKHQNVHKDEELGCSVCGMKFVNMNKLREHVLNVHNSFKNDEKKDCEEDLKLEDSEKKYICEYCSRIFYDEKECLDHVKKHIDEKAGEKDEEKKETGSDEVTNVFEDDNNSVSESEDDKTEDEMPSENFQCSHSQCGKLFASKRNLNRHMSTHSGLKFKCNKDKCDKEFSRADKLKEHERSKHSDHLFDNYDDDDDEDEGDTGDENKKKSVEKTKSNRPHQCGLCPKAFAHLQSLENHLERHQKLKDNPKRYLCDQCSRSYAQHGSLVAHMRTHTGVRPYVCQICSRAFTKSTYLQLHSRTHSGEKPYICQFCSRAFARANTLARHITMHTGEAKYQCKICRKAFRRLTSLNEHNYTHTGQRPYACKICSKRYNNAGSLYAHTKKCKTQQLIPKSDFNEFNPAPAVDVNGVGTTTPMIIYTQKNPEDSNQEQSFNDKNNSQYILPESDCLNEKQYKNSYQQMFFPPV